MKKIRLLLFLVFTLSQTILFAKIKNFGNPMKNLYRGGWLHNQSKDFKELKQLGVDTIVNLEIKSDNFELCSQYNMKCTTAEFQA